MIQSTLTGEVTQLSRRKMRLIVERYLASLSCEIAGTGLPRDRTLIEARINNHNWFIKISDKLLTPLNPLDIFTAALGEILQRMDNPADKYSIALPNETPFLRLWSSLPDLVKHRLNITALFVDPAGFIREEPV